MCDFRDGYSTQHALTREKEKWMKFLDNSVVVRTILMDL